MGCISKVTHEAVKQTAPDVSSIYLPHAVNSNVFYKYKTSDKVARVNEIRQTLSVGSSTNLKNPNKKNMKSPPRS